MEPTLSLPQPQQNGCESLVTMGDVALRAAMEEKGQKILTVLYPQMAALTACIGGSL